MDDKKRVKEQARIRSKTHRSLKKIMQNEQSQLASPNPSNEQAEDEIEIEDVFHNVSNFEDNHDDELECFIGEEQENDSFEDENGLFLQYYYEMHDDSSDDYSSDDDSSGRDDESNAVQNDDLNIAEEVVPPEIPKLRKWGIKINQKDLDELLGILRERLLPTLPKSAKTFLRTADAKYRIRKMDDARGSVGQFVYFSIKETLQDLVNSKIHPEKKIKLQVSADGVPLKKSSDDQFWVLSGKIHFEPDIYEVFAIAIFYGKSKPKNVEEYLEDFITEVNELQANGLYIEGQKFDFELKCFICDTPARAFLKNTLGHTGKEACERCEVVGKSVQSRTVYPDTEAPERTDASFRSRRQAKHHNGPTSLTRILPQINLVFFFILDFMHLCCNGIMKKLIEYWISGDLNVRLDVKGREELARRMEFLKSQIPFKFQRKTRTTASILKWKATELRFFLLYCGPIVLRKLLRKDFYEHFLLLHAAARILCCESLCHTNNKHAKIYLKTFFQALECLYGAASQILNAHHLIHVADDVMSMGCNLSRVTAFAFENYLGKLKRLLRTPSRQLAQVCRRLYEKKHTTKAYETSNFRNFTDR